MSGTLIELGMAAAALALSLSIAAVFFGVMGGWQQRPSFVQVARNSLYTNFALVSFCCFTLIWSFVQNDFSVAYVAQNSNTRLPLIYRLTAMWGAHEGPLLLWLWYLTVYSALALYLHWQTHPRSMPYIVATLGGIQFGFLVLILFLSSPFTELIPAPPEGKELNPLLQDPGLIVHPPILYLGYVGFVIPFAFAIAALVRGSAGAEWVLATRRWTLFAWLALTSGIMLGGYWAYYELGWGGYWAWDPVENASLMPWLTGTALLHSVMAQEKRNLFRGWNAALAVATFALSLLGTFLVRSGVLTSVHSFAVDPARGLYLLLFLATVVLGGFGLLVVRVDSLRAANRLETPFSREGTLLFNNLFLLVTAVTVFFGTLYPLAAEVLTGTRLTVAAPYFNKVVLPFMIALVMLMAVGPVMPWRRIGTQQLLDMLKLPVALSLCLVVTALAFGIRGLVPLAAIAAITLVLVTICNDLVRSGRAKSAVSGQSLLSSLASLALWNRRRYGGLVVHIGITVIAIGILASGLFLETKTIALGPEDRFDIGGFSVVFKDMQRVEGPNWTARQANLEVSQPNAVVEVMQPQRRTYPRGQMTTTEAAIRSSLAGDLYLVVGEELSGGRVSIRAYYIPLVRWIWAGWLIVIAGAFFALSQGRESIQVVRKAGTRHQAIA